MNASFANGGNRREVVIQNELGLHARSAAKIVAIANRANHAVWLASEKEEVDAKSTLDILSLNRPKGSRLTVRIEHPDDRDVLRAIVQLIEERFGE